MTENFDAPKDVKTPWEVALLQLTTFRSIRTVWDSLTQVERNVMINLESKARFHIRKRWSGFPPQQTQAQILEIPTSELDALYWQRQILQLAQSLFPIPWKMPFLTQPYRSAPILKRLDQPRKIQV